MNDFEEENGASSLLSLNAYLSKEETMCGDLKPGDVLWKLILRRDAKCCSFPPRVRNDDDDVVRFVLVALSGRKRVAVSVSR